MKRRFGAALAVLVAVATTLCAACSSSSNQSQTADSVDMGPGDVPTQTDQANTPDTRSNDQTTPGDATTSEMAELSPPPFPALPLKTQGRFIVDDVGRRVRLTGVNWNGAHEENMIPYGLNYHSPEVISQRLVELGLNSVRLTYADELVRDDPVPDPAQIAGWPEAASMTSMEVFDGVVQALTDAGLLVILNNHMSDAGWCCNDDDGNGLWYNPRFSEQEWIDHWVALAQRYADNPLVIGADLRNEPRQGALWSATADPAFDWPSAAEKCAAAVHQVRPDWLIFVEGVNYAAKLLGVQERPVVLTVPNKLVYSVHDYPWFSPNLMPTPELYLEVVDGIWGFLLSPPYEVPVWIGEFGICNDCWATDAWVGKFDNMVRQREMDWSLWMIFGDPGGGWGLMSAETLEVHSAVLQDLLNAWGAKPPVR